MGRFRSLLAFLLIPIIAFSFISCGDDMSEEEVLGTGKLSVTIGDGVSKTIEPASTAIEVASYSIEGKNGNFSFTSEKFTEKSYTVEKIVSGTWEVTVHGYNASNEEIASQTKNVVVSKGVNTLVNFKLAYISGSGSAEITIGVPSGDTKAQYMEMVVTPTAGGESTTYTASRNENAFTVEIDSISTGSYLAVMTIYDKADAGTRTRVGHPLKEAMNIYKGQESTYSFTWSEDFFPTAVPTIDVAAGTYEYGKQVTITAANGATIYYTTDGTVPTVATTTKSVEPVTLTLTEDVTVKAIAKADGLGVSDLVVASYIVDSNSQGVSIENPDHYAVAIEKVDGKLNATIAPEVAEGATVSYAWYLDGEKVADATTNEYTPTADGKKHLISVIVTIDGTMYSAYTEFTETSAATVSYAVGPAGGIVFYDCDADNDSGNTDGLTSSACGWRYLEAAPADLRVVNGSPTVDSSVEGYSNASTGYVFGFYRETADGSSLYVNGETTYNSDNCTGTAIGTGKTNTELLVGAMKTAAYTKENNTTADYAAKLCSDLVYGGYDDWFLPSKDELNLMYVNLYKVGLGGFAGDYYWSSSEYRADYAWEQDFSSGDQDYSFRGNGDRVRPLRAF